MEHRIGRATHGDVEGHGIEESIARSDIARQYALVAILIVSQGILYHLTGSSLEEFDTIGVGSQDSTIAWQREADSLCE